MEGDPSTKRLDPVLEPGQARPAGEVRAAPSVVADPDLKDTLISGRLHLRGGGAGVLGDALRLAQDNPRAATAALAPVLDSSAPGSHQVWLITAFLLEASARDALGEREAAGRALDLAEPDGLLFPFLLHPVPELFERQARQRTAHPALGSRLSHPSDRRNHNRRNLNRMLAVTGGCR